MPVPVKMADLYTIAASNSPAGSDPIGNSLDDYLRAGFSIIRSTNALASATLAAGSTVDLGSADAESVQITGSATITSLGTVAAGIIRECRFTGSCTITNSSAIALPNATNLSVVAGDVLRFRSLGSGNWVLVASARPQPAIADVVNLSATLAGLQPSLGYAPVNRAGDTMTGTLTVSENTNTASRSVLAQNLSNGSSAFSGYYFGNDASNTFAAFIIKNSSANAAYGGASSLNIVQNQAAPLTLVVGGSPKLTITSSGMVQASAGLQPTGDSAVPASGSGGTFHVAGFVTPTAGRTVFGDGTGWIYKWANRSGGVYNDIAQLTDTGALTINGAFIAAGATLGGGRLLTKITLSSSAPGALANGELYLQF